MDSTWWCMSSSHLVFEFWSGSQHVRLPHIAPVTTLEECKDTWSFMCMAAETADQSKAWKGARSMQKQRISSPQDCTMACEAFLMKPVYIFYINTKGQYNDTFRKKQRSRNIYVRLFSIKPTCGCQINMTGQQICAVRNVLHQFLWPYKKTRWEGLHCRSSTLYEAEYSPCLARPRCWK